MAANTSRNDKRCSVTIRIHGVEVWARIGVHEHEQHDRQPLVLHTTLEYDAAAAAKSDALPDALDYQSITRHMCECAEASNADLLETLLDALLDVVMEDKRVSVATVRIDKPNALKRAHCVSIEATRQRESATPAPT